MNMNANGNNLPVWLLTYTPINEAGSYELKFAATTDAEILAETGRSEPETATLNTKIKNVIAQHGALGIEWNVEKVK